jgi:DNA polymerase II small subunit/DNA polymerase delta subunit B
MACCLQWRHLCPTAPDTLTCYPFGADDPFVLQQCPHIMFAGNQPEFDTRLMEGEPAAVGSSSTVAEKQAETRHPVQGCTCMHHWLDPYIGHICHALL